jgi:hypothetical protein
MANPVIKIKRSATPGKVPTVSQLPLGEFAINTFDGKVFIAKNAGVSTEIVEVGISTTTVLSGIITTTNLEVTNTISGISSGSVKVSVVSDNGNQWHNVPYVDNATGYQTLKSNGLTYNPYIGKLCSGIGSFGTINGNIVSTAATITSLNNFVLPTLDGTNGQVLQTDGAGNLSFADVSGGGSAPVEEFFTATSGQTIFTTTTTLAGNFIEVFINGVKLRSTSDYTSSTNTVTLSSAASLNDEIDIIVYAGNQTETQITATQNQTVFTTSSNFSSGNYIIVYVNGVRVRRTTDFTTTTPTTVTFTSGLNAGDEVDIIIS